MQSLSAAKQTIVHGRGPSTQILIRLKFAGLHVIYQVRKSIFDYVSKHREEELKIRRTAEYLCRQTLSLVFDISSQSKLKLRRKRRNKIVKIYGN